MITVYGKPDAMCPACRMTKKKLTEADVEFEFIDLTEAGQDAALAYVTEELGYSQAPVVVVSDDDHWSGMDPTNLTRIIKRYGATT